MKLQLVIGLLILHITVACSSDNQTEPVSGPDNDIQTLDGHATGNGGDQVRATFLRMGEAVISHLRDSVEGQEIVRKNSLDMEALPSALDVRKIDIAEGFLLDNTGVPVDAIGIKDKITLNKDRWIEHFEKERDVYYLVFHEMLRALGINDDGYVISKALNPFPRARRVVTRISSIYPVTGEDRIGDWLKTDSLALGGTGCPAGQLGTAAEWDSERNNLEISFSNYGMIVEAASRMARKNCSLTLPVVVPQGKSLMISQMDMSAKLDLSVQTYLKLSSEVFWAGSSGVKEDKTIQSGEAPLKGRLLQRRNGIAWTECGANTNLRLNTSALAQTMGDGTSIIEIDRIVLSLKVESCADGGAPP